MAVNRALVDEIAKRGYTQKDFAKRAQIGVSSLRRMVSGHQTKPLTAWRVANALDTTPKALGLRIY